MSNPYERVTGRPQPKPAGREPPQRERLFPDDPAHSVERVHVEADAVVVFKHTPFGTVIRTIASRKVEVEDEVAGAAQQRPPAGHREIGPHDAGQG